MHHKTYQTAVVIIPPKEIWTSIQSIRRQHDANYRRWMPHITLIYPFRPRSEFEVVADQLAAICQIQSPFSVCLEPFRYFSHHRSRYTIWLDPKSPSGVSDKILCRPNPIVDLQTELWQTVPRLQRYSPIQKRIYTPSFRWSSNREIRARLFTQSVPTGMEITDLPCLRSSTHLAKRPSQRYISSG